MKTSFAFGTAFALVLATSIANAAPDAPSGGSGGGCSTTGPDSNAGAFAMMGLAGFGLALVVRARKKR